MKNSSKSYRLPASWQSLSAAFALIVVIGGSSSTAWCGASSSLWVGDTGNLRVDEIIPSKLKHSGIVSPIINDGTAVHDDEPEGVCFDSHKNLWVTGFNNSLLEFSPQQLKLLPSEDAPVPVAIITSASFALLVGCTFDRQGNLWAVNYDAGGVVEVSKAQLSAGTASIVPQSALTSADLDHPNFAVFDKVGNLWVTSEDNHKIAKFTPSQLNSGGSQTPAVLISDDGSGSLSDPGEPAFDGKGNLWVPNFGNGTVVMFKPSDLTSSGSPTPKVILSSTAVGGGQSLNTAWGLAFQGKGALWVSNYDSGNIAKFVPSQLKHSGSPVPKVFVQGAASQAYQITFGPTF